MTATTTRRYCLCGATAAVSSGTPSLVNGVIASWEESHTGEGHGPATQRQATTARRKADRANR